jgi:ABC-2 type transport system permease protein
MLSDALFLMRRDMPVLFRSRATWLWTFLMPIVFFYFVGSVTGRSQFAGRAESIAALVPPDAGFLADHLLRRVAERNYRVVRAGSAAEAEKYTRRLEIPAGFTGSVLAGRPANVTFTRKGSGLGADYDEVRLKRAVYTALADVIAAAAGADGTPTRESVSRIASEPHTLTLDVKPAGARLDPPRGFEQSVPGTMVMFTLLLLLTTGGVTLVIEREQGILRRLASSPMSRGAVVLGKLSSRLALGLIQIGFAMLAGSVLFGVRWGPHPVALGAVLVAYAALTASLGMLLGTFARTPGIAVGAGAIAANLMACLGGCWWPIEITPVWAQRLVLFLPTGLTMDALHKLVNFGAPPASVLPHAAVLAAAAALASWIAARNFRFA